MTSDRPHVALANVAALLGIALVAIGLYALNFAPAWSQRAGRPESFVWGIRLGAIGTLALAQVAFGLLVLPSFFAPGRFERRLALAGGAVAILCLAGAGAVAAASW